LENPSLISLVYWLGSPSYIVFPELYTLHLHYQCKDFKVVTNIECDS
jgi:hypothetical protein